MPNLDPLIGLFVTDPILGYSLLAAAFLLVVTVTAGLARLDLAALVEPRVALACALCVAAAVLLRLLVYGDLSDLQPRPEPLLAGVERFPLVLVALAYGPTAGLAVAALYASFGAQELLPAAREGVLALELALVGWLAIYPSPREFRWAGPVNALIAYALAWSTAGLALSQWQTGDFASASFLARQIDAWPGILASAVLLLMIKPAAYGRLFPHSRIWRLDDDGHVVIRPLSAKRIERDRELPDPPSPQNLAPEAGGRRSRRRSRLRRVSE